MSLTASTSTRFRIARERAGLSIADTAARAGIFESCVWDLESHNDELMSVYCAADLQRFAGVLSIAPWELVDAEGRDEPISADELAAAILGHCRVRKVTLEDFGDAVSWDVSKVVNTPQLLLSDISLDGIQDICRELGVDWRRFISGLSTTA